MFFSSLPTSEIAPGLFAVKTWYVHCFFYRQGGTVIGFDTGVSAGATAKGLAAACLSPESVTHLFLTHSDTDHVGGLSLFPDAQLYVPTLEVPLIEGRTRRSLLTRNRPIERPYDTLSDGTVVDAGPMRVKAISTPGHTSGSMAYLVDGSMLFSGDAVELKNNRAHKGPGFMSMNSIALEQSIHKLAELTGVAMMCTAHSGFTTDFDGAMEGWG